MSAKSKAVHDWAPKAADDERLRYVPKSPEEIQAQRARLENCMLSFII